MHIRISTRRRGNKSYTYAQLVESYRRPDGLPAHRVLASLRNLSEPEIENLQLALKASREGKTLVLAGAEETEEWRAKVLANLRYLDVAVALEIWYRWNLHELFNRLIPKRGGFVSSSSVIATLVVQRCTDPGSKLYAQRWFPRTALPELFDVKVEQFNNTRIHRVLNELDQVDETLQAELPKLYQQKEGAFVTIFMDVSDAWFEGQGPDLAERDRTKEGLKNRKKIGIVLVCNQDGYPLRWKVTPGKRRDPQCLEEMLSMIQEEDWIRGIPLVCDRAMGRGKSVANLIESGTLFLTATARNEIGSYTDAIPYQPFLKLSPVGTETTLKEEIAVAAKTAESAGLQKVDELLYILDLGVQERELTIRPRLKYSGTEWDPYELKGGASFIAQARIYQKQIDEKEFQSRSHLAKKKGFTKGRVTQIMNTLRIHEELQERILRGEFGYVPESLLRICIKYTSKAEQRRLLQEHANAVKTNRRKGPRPRQRVKRKKVRLRLVAYFNPHMFVEHRAILLGHRRRVEYFVDDLNRRLRSHTSRRKKDRVEAEVHNMLSKWMMIRVYDVRVRSVRDKETGRKHWEVCIHFNEEEWKRRISYTGFVLLIAHPDLPHSAEHLVGLFREKDAIEKDFQTIKETVKLRPLYHHTDPKVRAHVTLCMLALLLERTIERQLKRSSPGMTAAACFEELEACHLNIIRSSPALIPIYVATEATQEQRTILRSLRMNDLIDAEEIAGRIHPRANT